jgi:hypothetical protein
MPVILATQKTEIGGLWFEDSLGKKSEQDPISKTSCHGGACQSRGGIRRTMVRGQT